jgi:hypothetical protein
MRRLMLHPTPELPDDTPIEQVRFTWAMRRELIAARLTTVGAVREASDESLQSLKITAGLAAYIRETLS